MENILKTIFGDDYYDARDIVLVGSGFSTQKVEAVDIVKLLTILLPFLRKEKSPEEKARKKLKKLRKDLRKNRIDQEEYTLLRHKILKDLEQSTLK